MRRQEGQALSMVLVAMLILQAAAWIFLSQMNFEQRLAGGSTRSLAALYLAEAGLQKARWMLEEGPPSASGVGDWELPHRESLGAGAFVVETMERQPDGVIAIVVRGEVGGTARRVKALVRAGPEVLGYGLYGHATVTFDGQARTYVVPCRAGMGVCRSGGDLAASGPVSFDSTWTALNDFRGVWLSLRDGSTPDRNLLGSAIAMDPNASLIDIVLAGPAQLQSGPDHTPVGFDDLRRKTLGLGVRGLKTRDRLQAPVVDLEYFKALAKANSANASINAAAQMTSGKTDSYYAEEEFEAVVNYLGRLPTRRLQGVIFVDGDVLLEEGTKLGITDGALILQGSLEIRQRARFEVRHSDATRVLPGIIMLGEGSIFIREKGLAVVDGLILAGKEVWIEGGVLDDVGAVVSRVFLSNDGTVVVRYDSAVLSTVGLRRVGRSRTDLLSWQELR